MMVGRFFGPELITVAADRDMSAGQSNWVVDIGIEVTWDNVDMDWNCTGLNQVRLPVILIEGTLYRVEYEISAWTSNQLTVYLGGESYQTPWTYAKVFILYMVAGPQNWIRFSSTNLVASVDNVSIKEVL